MFPCAIRAGETPVGFLLMEEDERTLMLRRIMLPEEHTGFGCGRARASGRYGCLQLDCAPENHRARRLYEGLGFRPTGEINRGSVAMALPLTE